MGKKDKIKSDPMMVVIKFMDGEVLEIQHTVEITITLTHILLVTEEKKIYTILLSTIKYYSMKNEEKLNEPNTTEEVRQGKFVGKAIKY